MALDPGAGGRATARRVPYTHRGGYPPGTTRHSSEPAYVGTRQGHKPGHKKARPIAGLLLFR